MCPDIAAVYLNLPIRLGVIRCPKVGLDGRYTTEFLEELRYNASALVSYEFLQRTAVEQTRIFEVVCDFGSGDILHRYGFFHLGIQVCNDKEMLIFPDMRLNVPRIPMNTDIGGSLDGNS